MKTHDDGIRRILVEEYFSSSKPGLHWPDGNIFHSNNDLYYVKVEDGISFRTQIKTEKNISSTFSSLESP